MNPGTEYALRWNYNFVFKVFYQNEVWRYRWRSRRRLIEAFQMTNRKKNKKTPKNGWQNTMQKITDWTTRTFTKKAGINLGAAEALPASPVLSNILFNNVVSFNDFWYFSDILFFCKYSKIKDFVQTYFYFIDTLYTAVVLMWTSDVFDHLN